MWFGNQTYAQVYAYDNAIEPRKINTVNKQACAQANRDRTRARLRARPPSPARALSRAVQALEWMCLWLFFEKQVQCAPNDCM